MKPLTDYNPEELHDMVARSARNLLDCADEESVEDIYSACQDALRGNNMANCQVVVAYLLAQVIMSADRAGMPEGLAPMIIAKIALDIASETELRRKMQ